TRGTAHGRALGAAAGREVRHVRIPAGFVDARRTTVPQAPRPVICNRFAEQDRLEEPSTGIHLPLPEITDRRGRKNMKRIQVDIYAVVMIAAVTFLLSGQDTDSAKKRAEAGATSLLSQPAEEKLMSACAGTWICTETWTTTKRPRPGIVSSGCYRVSRRCG